jgi:hypothetical protein
MLPERKDELKDVDVTSNEESSAEDSTSETWTGQDGNERKSALCLPGRVTPGLLAVAFSKNVNHAAKSKKHSRKKTKALSDEGGKAVNNHGCSADKEGMVFGKGSRSEDNRPKLTFELENHSINSFGSNCDQASGPLLETALDLAAKINLSKNIMSQLTALENRSDGGQDDPQAVDVQTDLIFAGDSLNDNSVHVSSHLPILVTNPSAIDDLEDQEHSRDVENLEDIIAGVEQPFQGQAEEGVDLNDYMEYYELPVKIEKSVERFETLEDVSGEELHRNDEDFEQHAKEVGGLLQAIAKDKFDELDEEHPKLMLLDANEAINSEAETEEASSEDSFEEADYEHHAYLARNNAKDNAGVGQTSSPESEMLSPRAGKVHPSCHVDPEFGSITSAQDEFFRRTIYGEAGMERAVSGKAGSAFTTNPVETQILTLDQLDKIIAEIRKAKVIREKQIASASASPAFEKKEHHAVQQPKTKASTQGAQEATPVCICGRPRQSMPPQQSAAPTVAPYLISHPEIGQPPAPASPVAIVRLHELEQLLAINVGQNPPRELQRQTPSPQIADSSRQAAMAAKITAEFEKIETLASAIEALNKLNSRSSGELSPVIAGGKVDACTSDRQTPAELGSNQKPTMVALTPLKTKMYKDTFTEMSERPSPGAAFKGPAEDLTEPTEPLLTLNDGYELKIKQTAPPEPTQWVEVGNSGFQQKAFVDTTEVEPPTSGTVGKSFGGSNAKAENEEEKLVSSNTSDSKPSEIIQNVQNNQQTPALVNVVNSPAAKCVSFDPKTAQSQPSAAGQLQPNLPTPDQEQTPAQQPSARMTEELVEAMKTIHALEQAIEDLKAIEKRTSDVLERAVKQFDVQQASEKASAGEIYSHQMGSMDLHKLCLKHPGGRVQDERIGSGYFSGGFSGSNSGHASPGTPRKPCLKHSSYTSSVGSSFQLQQGNSYLKAKSPPFEQHLPSGGAQEVQHLDEPMDLMNQQVYDETPMVQNVSYDQPSNEQQAYEPPSPGSPHSAVLLDSNNKFHSIVTLKPPHNAEKLATDEPEDNIQGAKKFLDTSNILNQLSKFQKSLLAAHEEQAASNESTEKKSQGSFPFTLNEGVNVQIRSASSNSQPGQSSKQGMVRLFQKSDRVPQATEAEGPKGPFAWFKRKQQQVSDEPPQAGYYSPQSPVKYLSPVPGSPRAHDRFYKKGAKILQERLEKGSQQERRHHLEPVPLTPSVMTSYWPGYSDTQSSTYGFNPNDTLMSGDEFFATSVAKPGNTQARQHHHIQPAAHSHYANSRSNTSVAGSSNQLVMMGRKRARMASAEASMPQHPGLMEPNVAKHGRPSSTWSYVSPRNTKKQTSKQSSAYSFVEPQTTSSRARRRSAASYPSSPRARGALNARSRSSMTAVRNSNRGRSRGFLGSLLVRIHEMLESEDRLTSTMALALLCMPLVIMIHQEMRSNGGRSPIPTITAAMNSA